MINLVYSGNYAIFYGILTSLISVAKFNKDEIHAYLLTMDLSDENEKYKPLSTEQAQFLENYLKKINPNSTCKIIDMTQVYKKDSLNYNGRFTPYALLRLYASVPEVASLLPEKFLYLDADTLILNSIQELFNTDISNYELGVVRDYMGRHFYGRNYFNSGVMLMNMKKIIETGLLDKTRKMCSEKNFFLVDQTALNKCVNSKLILPDKFNSQRRIKKDTVIRHYCASWRFFPIIRIKNVKQWEVEKILKDKHHVYKNDAVEEILKEFVQIKENLK